MNLLQKQSKSSSKPEMLSYFIIFSGEEERIMGTQQGLKVAFHLSA